ncbi:ankyrin repeat protein [Gregarina niphandrodes]|uniref:Ankyrin repeat protein n=1 Tax=Gregarina niphandrodes TaxID=110365 RepID=A0A023B0H1_GRENI|nr:ankyrin repeat protein [Gregarina niphandrodes]EZG44277.1 ankyrin repeat protein [Gregarina niphandrodes]|eukprot:XP_011132728.1 ankyrin repeat protein [Gregarina niphandrodes]
MSRALSGSRYITPTILQVVTGEMEALQASVSQDPETICQQDQFGWSPVEHAVACGNLAALEMFLRVWNRQLGGEAGVARDERNIRYQNLAIEYNRPDVLRWLGRNGFLDSPCAVNRAVAHGSVACLRLLLAEGHEASEEDAWGEVPLFLAVKKRRVDMVKCLLDHQPELARHRDVMGRTAAHQCDSVALLEVLDRYGTDLWQTDNLGQTPFDLALRRRNASLLEYLLISSKKNPPFNELEQCYQSSWSVA